MKNILLYIAFTGMVILFLGCGKKTVPEKKSDKAVVEYKNSAVGTASKPVAIKKIKTAVPKVIVVNDKVASKTFDGRYYYDLDGKRYWRNNVDGKYYLYNKSMHNDPAFKSPQ